VNPNYLWREIEPSELESWDLRLMQTSAHFAQFPFWNEPYRVMKLQPVYACCYVAGMPVCYVAIVSIGPPRLRIGLVHRGPVNLISSEPPDVAVLIALRDWARSHGYVFLRFVGFDSRIQERVALVSPSKRVDSFPVWGGLSTHSYMVDLQESEQAMLGGFQNVAVRNIKAARKTGYEILSSDDPDVLTKAWPLFENLAVRKGIAFPRPLISWQEVVRRGAPLGAATLHTAHLEGKTIQLILTVRDSRITEYMIGVLDVEALGKRPSPACLLHYHAMREALRKGCRIYDLGPPSGPVAIFKQKFRPRDVIAPPTVTMITMPRAYRIWSGTALRLAIPFWPYAKAALARWIRTGPTA